MVDEMLHLKAPRSTEQSPEMYDVVNTVFVDVMDMPNSHF